MNLRKVGSVSALMLAASLGPGPATSGEYQLVLGLDQIGQYDDNVDFTREDEIEATSYVITPQLKLDGRNEHWDLGVDLDLPFERYSEDRLNSDNQDLQIVSKRRLERGELNLAGGILRDSTHRSEEDSSGIVTRNAQRRVLDTFSGSWTRRLGERDEITFGGNKQTADYAAGTSLHDYDYGSLHTGWTRVLNERMSTQLTVFDSRLESEVDPSLPCTLPPFVFCFPPPVPLPDAQTDTVGIQAGFVRVFSDRLRGTFELGWRHLETTNHGAFVLFDPDASIVIAESTDSSDGGLGSIGFTYAGQRIELSATLSEDLTPSGIGVLFERQQLLVDLAYRMRERLRLRVHAVAYNNDSLDESVPFSRKYYGVRPYVDWRFRQNWSLLGGVEIRSQELLVDSDPARSNQVFLAVTYASQPLPVFR